MDIERLKQLALDATPGPWLIDESDLDTLYEVKIGADAEGGYIEQKPHYPVAPERIEDGRFIAAANPATVLDLIAQRDELLAACVEFVRKVEFEGARSVRSYAQMKAAIAKCEVQS